MRKQNEPNCTFIILVDFFRKFWKRESEESKRDIVRVRECDRGEIKRKTKILKTKKNMCKSSKSMEPKQKQQQTEEKNHIGFMETKNYFNVLNHLCR